MSFDDILTCAGVAITIVGIILLFLPRNGNDKGDSDNEEYYNPW